MNWFVGSASLELGGRYQLSFGIFAEVGDIEQLPTWLDAVWRNTLDVLAETLALALGSG